MFRNYFIQMWRVGKRDFHNNTSVENTHTFHWKSAGNLRKYWSCQKWDWCHDKQEIENVDNSLQLKLLCLLWRQKTFGVRGNWLTHAQLILSLSIWDVKFLPIHERRLVIQEKHPSRLRLPLLQTQKANVSALFNVSDTSCACLHKVISIHRRLPTLLECDRRRMRECKEESAITELWWSDWGLCWHR